MAIQLFRIDDRLIHGQVVIGWASYLKSERILLCDDEVVSSEWERNLYLTCVPGQLQALVLSLDDTIKFLKDPNSNNKKTIFLAKSPKTVCRMVDRGYLPQNINLGGIHYADGREKYLSYLYLNDTEVNDLQYLLEKNIHIYCQDVPTGKRYNLDELLNK